MSVPLVDTSSSNGEENYQLDEGSSVLSTSDTTSPRYRMKRSNDNHEGDDDRSNKKSRFYWPDALHKDFIVAIFDVGLRNAVPGDILELIQDDSTTSTNTLPPKLDAARIQAQIAKFQMLRKRSSSNYLSYYEKSMLSESELSGAAIHKSENEKIAQKQKLFLLRKQLNVVNNTIDVQSNFLNVVKSCMESQLKTQEGIIQLISQLDPSYTSSLRSNNLQQQQLISSLPAYQSEHVPEHVVEALPNSRVELQIMSEMRTHMDLHRRLMLRKEDQVSEFTAVVGHTSQAASTGVCREEQSVDDVHESSDWNWSDNIDEHLFSFLVSTAPGTDNEDANL